jgi:hypothetical protein
MMEGDGKEGVDDLKQRLAGGENLEIAGYELSSQLWGDIENNELMQYLGENLGRLLIAEIGKARDDGLSPAGRRIQEVAKRAGLNVEGRRIDGEPFWSATEVVVNPSLISATVDFITKDDSR